MKRARFAGGCFWCMEPPFAALPGVVHVCVGYAQDRREAVEIVYDARTVSYRKLLEVFWRQIDPTDAGGQFADRGPSYRSAVYYFDARQKAEAWASRRALAASGRFSRPIVTPILPAGAFHPAEEAHQRFYAKHPERYRLYRRLSGREAFLARLWRDDAPSNEAAFPPRRRET